MEGPDNLDDLIRFLEEEQAQMKKCVDEAAAAWEFGEAKAFAKTYSEVSRRLEVLQNLKDPGFNQRARHQRMLIRLEETIKTYSQFPNLVNHFQKEVDQTKLALDQLATKKYALIDTQYIDDAIFQLVQGVISSFSLYLNKSEEVVMDFICRGQALHIVLSYRKGSLYGFMKKGLRRLGFVKVNGARQMIRVVDISNFKDAIFIKQFLAVVLFDVLGRTWLDSPVDLEINPSEPPE